ncbi:hypothetical protein [Dialister sp.]
MKFMLLFYEVLNFLHPARLRIGSRQNGAKRLTGISLCAPIHRSAQFNYR